MEKTTNFGAKEVKIEYIEPSDFYPNPEARTHSELFDESNPRLPERAVASKKANGAGRLGEAQTIMLSDLEQEK